MFKAVREVFGGLRGRRWRVLARLFLFEFTVVVLGVLAAQAAQDWPREREAKAFAQAELIRLTQGYYDARGTGEIWRRATPCLRTGVETVMLAAAAGETPPARYLLRPRLFETESDDASPDTWRRITAILGDQSTFALADARRRAVGMVQYEQVLLREWEKFRLLDPAFGTSSERDRAMAREAGIAILIALRNMDIAVLNLDEMSRFFSLPDPAPLDTALDGTPVENCDQIWRDGRIYVDTIAR